MASFSLGKLPWQAQIGLFVAISLAGAGAFYYFYERPVTTTTNAFFNASAFTAGTAPIATYRFNYGDGSTDDVGPSATQSHRFTATGIYTVRVTATDTLGRTATTTLTVTVT